MVPAGTDNDALMQAHHEAVQRVCSQVRIFHDQKRHFRVYHGTTSSTRPVSLTRDAIVDVSNMRRIFPVEKESMTVRAEPNVPMDELVAHCIEAGCIPKIVMEFKGITCGGGFSGMSGETNMHKYGLFQNTCCEVEIVLGNGTLVLANRTQNTDLLHEAGGSLGTFGIVTLLTIELLPATSHVQLQILPVNDPLTIPSLFEEAASNSEIDYMEGIYFGRQRAVVMFGRRIDFAQRSPAALLLTTKQVHWFSDHVERQYRQYKSAISIATTGRPEKEKVGHALPRSATTAQMAPLLLTMTDYLFRYDHGAFWGGKLAFAHYHIPMNRITRALADPFLDSRTCYRALHRTGLADEYIVQDFGMPASTVVQFITYVSEVMPQCQLFLCAMRSASQVNIAARFNAERIQRVRDERIFGVGVYGRGPADREKFIALNRALEQRASELSGAKMLYARIYYTKEEFWEIYDERHYNELRKRYHADTLLSVYDKLKIDMSCWRKQRSVKGLAETIWDKAVGKKEYLLRKG